MANAMRIILEANTPFGCTLDSIIFEFKNGDYYSFDLQGVQDYQHNTCYTNFRGDAIIWEKQINEEVFEQLDETEEEISEEEFIKLLGECQEIRACIYPAAKFDTDQFDKAVQYCEKDYVRGNIYFDIGDYSGQFTAQLDTSSLQ